jgi:hypothetical protein
MMVSAAPGRCGKDVGGKQCTSLPLALGMPPPHAPGHANNKFLLFGF